MRALMLVAATLLCGLPAQAKSVKKKPRPTIELSFRAVGGAQVYYGKKLLGVAPFKIRWPKDSGPLDLVVKKPGYFNVNTRAYTFESAVISVRMTPRSKAHTLYGYKAPIKVEEDAPEGEEQSPDAPATPPAAPGSVTPLAPAGAQGVAPGKKKAGVSAGVKKGVSAGVKKAPGVAPLQPAPANR